MVSACMGLIILGVLLLLASLLSVAGVASRIPAGKARLHWRLLMGLVVVFAVGYLIYAALCAKHFTKPTGIIVPLIFFLGGGFVFLNTRLALEAVDVVKKVGRLESENATDPLMGIFNRRYFDRRLPAEVARALRYGLELSLLVIDIDHFKRVNDDHGHRAGDAVLAGLGDLLAREVRACDIPARYGGEEIAVIMTNTGLSGARVLAERIRAAVERTVFAGDGVEMHCTVSVGVAALDETCREAPALVEAADKALYRAKETGRNRVEVAGNSRDEVPCPPGISSS